jgi:dihydroneopterin aldolase
MPHLHSISERIWTIIIRDLEIMAYVGIYEHEQRHAQKILINVTCDYKATCPQDHDGSLSQVLCYERLTQSIIKIVKEFPRLFLESLAESIINLCFEDSRVLSARVRVEKLEAIQDTRAVGIELTHSR